MNEEATLKIKNLTFNISYTIPAEFFSSQNFLFPRTTYKLLLMMFFLP